MKEEIDYNEFVTDLLVSSYISEETVESILEINKDCKYDGVGYITLFHEIEHLAHIDLSKGLEQIVSTDEFYDPFSKTVEGVEKLRKNKPYHNYIELVIEVHITGGLDIMKLIKKHKNILEPEMVTCFEETSEVVSKVDKSFKIVSHKLHK
ncbi:hypothetical protein ACQUY5_27075 [Bacillus cereus]|uniref:hypothetical protein n=1 Tax=Bacillus cereus TaxID=1396 RepID=UPI003D16CC63